MPEIKNYDRRKDSARHYYCEEITIQLKKTLDDVTQQNINRLVEMLTLLNLYDYLVDRRTN